MLVSRVEEMLLMMRNAAIVTCELWWDFWVESFVL